ncbi:MAG TPA: alpha/beta hydrolase [Candidatus Limnocylindrales bacterium]|nr:alpha/beta hydrolase [Candidatus Limnocylindrales bacterium]
MSDFRVVRSRDGTPIAVFSSGTGPPIVLVHGAAADHTTFRVVGPMLAERFTVHAIDRRGRGASGDGDAYAVEREFEDVAAVAEAVAGHGQAVDVVGHSFGGRVALGAALVAPSAIRRLVVYEGAPPAGEHGYQSEGLSERLRAILADRGPEALLETFLREVVGMTNADIDAYRANPVWPARVAAAHTIVRELEAELSAAAGLDALAGVRQPVLQVLGGDSLPAFGEATEALDARLADGRVVVIDGARHAAHHTHPDRFVAEVEAFIAG